MWPEELARWAAALLDDECALRGVLYRAGGDRERGREAFSRAMLSALRLYERMEGEKRKYDYFRAWMIWKARRLLIDEFRILSRVRQLDDESSLEETKGNEVRQRRIDALREVIDELPEDERRLMTMRLEGWTFEEIAEKEGVNPGTIHRRLQGPLRRVRERLWETDADLFRGLIGEA